MATDKLEPYQRILQDNPDILQRWLQAAQGTFSAISSAADHAAMERAWLDALERKTSKGIATVSAMTGMGRVLTPGEIAAVIGYLNVVDQYYSYYKPAADALLAAGWPKLSQRLAQVRQDLQRGMNVYQEMLRGALVDIAPQPVPDASMAAALRTHKVYEHNNTIVARPM